MLITFRWDAGVVRHWLISKKLQMAAVLRISEGPLRVFLVHDLFITSHFAQCFRGAHKSYSLCGQSGCAFQPRTVCGAWVTLSVTLWCAGDDDMVKPYTTLFTTQQKNTADWRVRLSDIHSKPGLVERKWEIIVLSTRWKIMLKQWIDMSTEKEVINNNLNN